MQFGRWYPLAEAGDHAPDHESVVQLRLVTGLVDYPRGKSAMVWYGHVTNAREAALALAAQYRDRDLLCRHLIEIDDRTNLGTFYAKLRAEFERRFGMPPTFENP